LNYETVFSVSLRDLIRIRAKQSQPLLRWWLGLLRQPMRIVFLAMTHFSAMTPVS